MDAIRQACRILYTHYKRADLCKVASDILSKEECVIIPDV